jgi:mono/diheme cytochrome c family protein
METRGPTPSSSDKRDTPPEFGARRIPFWLVIALCIVFLCTQVYVSTYSGSFRADVYDEHQKAPPSIPIPPRPPFQKVYVNYCAPCHQLNGLGVPGLFPPLAGSEWVNEQNPDRLIRIVLDGASGPISVKGAVYNNLMIPWRDTLTNDNDVAAVLTYIRSQWGNRASPVTPERVQAVRAETLNRTGAWSETELLAIPSTN